MTESALTLVEAVGTGAGLLVIGFIVGVWFEWEAVA
jgi:hypothetical protein